MSLNFSYDTEEYIAEETSVLVDAPGHLIVYNDDYNTFEWVIESFMEVCGCSSEQAEQLSLIIHFKGKATVKTASFEVLKPMRRELVSRGLSAVIEKVTQD